MSEERKPNQNAPLLVRFKENGSIQSFPRSKLTALAKALGLTETATVREALARMYVDVMETNKPARNEATPSGFRSKK